MLVSKNKRNNKRNGMGPIHIEANIEGKNKYAILVANFDNVNNGEIALA